MPESRLVHSGHNCRVCHFSFDLEIFFDVVFLFLRLVHILKHSPSPQMSYQVAFCFWLLSFEQDVAEQINKYALSLISFKSASLVIPFSANRKYDIIPLLIDVAQAAVKEKVIRVVVATFRVAFRILLPLTDTCWFPWLALYFYCPIAESYYQSPFSQPSGYAGSSPVTFC